MVAKRDTLPRARKVRWKDLERRKTARVQVDVY